MLEDKLLVWSFKRGSTEALRRIYEKYKKDLLALAVSLSNDTSFAEDAVHDVFVSFAQLGEGLKLRANLKGYLLTAVANRVCSIKRSKYQKTAHLEENDISDAACDRPESLAVCAEKYELISRALASLPYQQREVITLHLQGGVKFRTIAKSQGVSISTIQSRYRYGLDKLQSMLNGEVKK